MEKQSSYYPNLIQDHIEYFNYFHKFKITVMIMETMIVYKSFNGKHDNSKTQALIPYVNVFFMLLDYKQP